MNAVLFGTVARRQLLKEALVNSGVMGPGVALADLDDFQFGDGFSHELCARRRGEHSGSGGCTWCQHLWDHIMDILLTKITGMKALITSGLCDVNVIDRAAVSARIFPRGSSGASAKSVAGQGTFFGGLSMNKPDQAQKFREGLDRVFHVILTEPEFAAITALYVGASSVGIASRAATSLGEQDKGRTWESMVLAAGIDERVEYNMGNGLEATVRRVSLTQRAFELPWLWLLLV